MLAVPKIEIRQVQTGDLEDVVRLEELSFDDPYPLYFLTQLAEANPDTFLVAVSERVLVGYAVLDRWQDSNHLISIAVRPESRRRGIAGQLLSGLEDRARAGWPLRLEVRRGNVAAIGFYLKHGFRETGVEPGYYRNGEDALLMEKRR